ncbi:hypothetical protein O1611_g43 [Lasiodiplodia mahajangana]|uniref:Uncharacterized protein n=1 Tax=Lasiodiplodia mahajangana TaxID=1108764 RepID=A0ACC2K1M3_9PEZI|nr:hypothetical protein O1611_g43 [Lasiodiplodia mahajangana]
MNYPACLVVINDAEGRPAGAESLSDIANRFRCRHVREFDFISPMRRSLGKGALRQRAEDILQELVADSQLALGKGIATEKETLVFFGYGLAGLLVKQIVLSAATSSRYKIVSQSIGLLVFIGTPHRTKATSLPIKSKFHPLSVVMKNEIVPINLLSALQSELLSLEEEFPMMLMNKFNMVNFIGESTTGEDPSVAPNERCSTMGVPREENIRLPCSYSELREKVVTEKIAIDTIIKNLEQKVGPMCKVKPTSQLHDFLELLGEYTAAGLSASSTWARSSASDSINWVQATEGFTSWINKSGTSVLHVTGRPGSGATVLTSHVIDLLISNGNVNPVVATFTTTARTTTSSLSVVTEMLIALSQQLLSLRSDAFRNCAFLCSLIMNNPAITITEAIAWSLLRRAVSSIRDPIYLIIRDLDLITGWQYVLLDLCGIARQGQVLRVLVTTARADWGNLCGRDAASDPDLHQNLGKDHYFSIHLENQQALSSAIEAAVRERIVLWRQEKPLRPDLEEEVVPRICTPKTTYFLATQQIDYLRSSLPHTTESCLTQSLEALPQTHNAIYDRTLESLPQATRDWATVALAWVVFSIRRLDKDELALALAFESGNIQEVETMRRNVSHNIVSDLPKAIRPFFKIVGSQVNPIHRTMGEMPGLDAHRAKFHVKATVTCLTYLSVILDCGNIVGPNGELSDEAMKSTDYGFLSYSVIHWPDHCLIAMSGNDEDLVNRIYRLLEKPQLLSTWSKLYATLTKSKAWEQPIAPLSSGINVACRFGILPLLKVYSSSLGDYSGVEEVWAKALSLAAQFGHTAVVSWLLQNGATSADALLLAAAGGHVGIVDIFLERKYDPVSKDSVGYSAILYAAERGHTGVLNRLLENAGEEPINETNPDGLSALHLASRIGCLEGVERLLAKGGDPMQEDISGQIPLHLAAAGGYADVVSAFTLRPALVTKATSAENGAHTPLHLAALSGDTETCQRLLTAGSPSLLSIKDKRGLTPLQVASESGSLETVRLFLDRPDELDVRNHEETTEAAEEIQARRSRLLITDATHSDESPEVWAAGNGHVTVMMESLNRLAQKGQSMDSTVGADCLNTLQEAHSCLRIAARNGQIDALEQLLQVGVDAASPDSAGNTVLHLAVKANRLMVVEKLVKKASLEDKNVALALAVQLENIDIVRELIRNGAEVAATAYADRSPLHAVAEKGNETIMSELLKTKTGLRLFFGETMADIVLLAARNSHVTFIKRLFSLIYELSERRHSEEEYGKKLLAKLLQVPSISSNPEALEALFKATYRSGLRGYAKKILHIAAEHGHSNVIKTLVEHGVDIDHKTDLGSTPLILATKSGHISTCSYLLNSGADVDGRDNEDTTALIIACQSGSKELVKLLLDSNANINAINRHGEAPLYAAISAPEIMRLLLKRSPKPDVEIRDYDGRTPLLEATIMGKLESVDLLLEENAEINATDKFGRTCLHLAIQKRHLNIVERLIGSGVDCNARDSNGETPLHVAAYEGLYETVEYLIPKITDINALSRNHGSVLAEVAAGAGSYRGVEGYTKCAEILLSNGANINCYGGFYHSPLQAAASSGVEELVRLYIHHNAVVDAKEGDSGGDSTTALYAAVENDRADLAKILVEAGASPTVDLGHESTILSYAIGCSTVEVVEVLLNPQSEPISQETLDSAVREAAHNDELDIFKLLVAKGALGEKAQGQPPILFDVIKFRSQSVLSYLLEDGKNLINIDETNVYGTTALAYAITEHPYEDNNVDELLEAGADPNIADDRGNTPLILAVKDSRDRFLEPLLTRNYEADKVVRFDMLDFAGRGALYWACYSTKDEMFNTIIEHLSKQEANAADYSSAMHAASARNRGNMLERLSEIGGDPTQLDRNNWSLMDTATEYGATSVLQLLPTLLEGQHQNPRDTVEFKRPTSWNRMDVHRQVEISDDGLRMKSTGPGSTTMGRSNFCMPTNTSLYYFEVTIEKLMRRWDDKFGPPKLGVGFCEEHVDLDSMVGHCNGSWGHHLHDGTFHSKSSIGESSIGKSFIEKSDPSYTGEYAEGDTIGCGVDFGDRTAFFTRNGTFLGKVFAGIRGKLYPAVSFGWNVGADSSVLVNFGDDPAIKFKFNPSIESYNNSAAGFKPKPTQAKARTTKGKKKKAKTVISRRYGKRARVIFT